MRAKGGVGWGGQWSKSRAPGLAGSSQNTQGLQAFWASQLLTVARRMREEGCARKGSLQLS